MKNKAAQILRFLAGAGLLIWLLKRIDMSHLGEAIQTAFSHPEWLAAGILFTFMGLLSGVIRWWIILRAQGITLSGWQTFRIFFIGQFFNVFMPGACGGDVARAFYVVKSSLKGSRAEAASTVFIDRAIGLFAIIACCCGVISLRLPFIFRQQETEIPGIMMLSFLLIALLGLFALFRRNLFEHFEFFRKLEYQSKLGGLVRRAYDTVYLLRSMPMVLGKALVFSVLNLVFLTLACYSFGHSLELDLRWIDYFTLFPIITVLSAIPLTPGALGIRENLFVAMFGVLGTAPAAALSLSLINYAGGAACSLLGGIFFISYSSGEYVNLKHEIEDMQDEDPAKKSSPQA